jgi:hypothetical protein
MIAIGIKKALAEKNREINSTNKKLNSTKETYGPIWSPKPKKRNITVFDVLIFLTTLTTLTAVLIWLTKAGMT